jgi:hypothetical protein
VCVCKLLFFFFSLHILYLLTRLSDSFLDPSKFKGVLSTFSYTKKKTHKYVCTSLLSFLFFFSFLARLQKKEVKEKACGVLTGRYLVDPASNHMLVLKIKPCMSKYKHLYGETANGSLNQL